MVQVQSSYGDNSERPRYSPFTSSSRSSVPGKCLVARRRAERGIYRTLRSTTIDLPDAASTAVAVTASSASFSGRRQSGSAPSEAATRYEPARSGVRLYVPVASVPPSTNARGCWEEAECEAKKAYTEHVAQSSPDARRTVPVRRAASLLEMTTCTLSIGLSRTRRIPSRISVPALKTIVTASLGSSCGTRM